MAHAFAKSIAVLGVLERRFHCHTASGAEAPRNGNGWPSGMPTDGAYVTLRISDMSISYHRTVGFISVCALSLTATVFRDSTAEFNLTEGLGFTDLSLAGLTMF